MEILVEKGTSIMNKNIVTIFLEITFQKVNTTVPLCTNISLLTENMPNCARELYSTFEASPWSGSVSVIYSTVVRAIKDRYLKLDLEPDVYVIFRKISSSVIYSCSCNQRSRLQIRCGTLGICHL